MASALVVDDAMFMRKMVGDILIKNCGISQIFEAVNGKDAADKYALNKPDVVIMDITMPEVTGLEGVKLIIKDFPDAKIIMCSAMGQQAMVVEAIQSGAKDFIVKPAPPDRLQEAVLRQLNS